MISRRKFLKFLAVGIPAALSPIPVIPTAEMLSAADLFSNAEIPEKPEFWAVMPIRWVTFDELRADYEPVNQAKLDNHPLLSGELGIYDGVTIHDHK